MANQAGCDTGPGRRHVDDQNRHLDQDDERQGQDDFGIKGVGELGNVGMNAAVANAVFHATRDRVRELPIRLEKLLGAAPLQQA